MGTVLLDNKQTCWGLLGQGADQAERLVVCSVLLFVCFGLPCSLFLGLGPMADEC